MKRERGAVGGAPSPRLRRTRRGSGGLYTPHRAANMYVRVHACCHSYRSKAAARSEEYQLSGWSQQRQHVERLALKGGKSGWSGVIVRVNTGSCRNALKVGERRTICLHLPVENVRLRLQRLRDKKGAPW
eukprot:6212546-Pleurochrysis_carterae.AAC.4